MLWGRGKKREVALLIVIFSLYDLLRTWKRKEIPKEVKGVGEGEMRWCFSLPILISPSSEREREEEGGLKKKKKGKEGRGRESTGSLYSCSSSSFFPLLLVRKKKGGGKKDPVFFNRLTKGKTLKGEEGKRGRKAVQEGLSTLYVIGCGGD